MPIYVYKCENGHKIELTQKFSDKPLETCPQCGKPVKKIITNTNFKFK